MNAIRNILSVARYERLLLLRTTRFRILGGIGVAVPVLIGGLLAVLEAQGVELAATLSLGSFIPFYVYSYLQTVVIVFIVGDFRLEDERAQVYEVVAGRPISTAELVSGKYLGIAGALITLSLAVLVLTVAIEAAKISITGASFSLWPYLAYLLLMTLPALFYMSALSFFLGAVLRQQAAVVLLTIAYSLAVLFYLGEKHGGLFDFGAFFAPLFYSDMIGLGDVERTIDQRLFYLALALCFFGLSIDRYPRLPQSRAWTWCGRGAALVGLGAAVGLCVYMEQQDLARQNFRQNLLAEQRLYAARRSAQILHYDLDLNLLENGTPLRARAGLRLKNTHASALDTLIFTLNPGLALRSIQQSDGTAVQWERETAVIRVAQPLAPGAQTMLKLDYQGDIDLQGFDLRRGEKRIHKSKWPFIKGDLTAWIRPESIFLPPRSRWYPVAGVDYGHVESRPPAFATAALTVSVPAALEVITQGKPGERETAGGRVKRVWQVERPLSVFSLNAGVYEVFEASVHGIDCALYVHPAHQRQVLFFADAREQVLESLEQMLDAVEQELGLDYPYPRLSVVEVPFQVQWYYEGWQERGGLTQPGVLMVEEDVLMSQRFSQNFARFSQRGQRFFDPVQMKPMLLLRAISQVFFAREGARSGLFRSPVAQLWSFDRVFHGEHSALMERGMPLHLQEDLSGAITASMFSRGGGRSRGRGMRRMGAAFRRSGEEAPENSWDTLMVQMQQQPFAAMDPDKDPAFYRAVLEVKSTTLFRMVGAVLGKQGFLDVMNAFSVEQGHAATSFEDFAEAAQNRAPDDRREGLQNLVHDWLHGTHVPGYTLTRALARKVDDGWGIVYQVIVRLRNGEPGRGFVQIQVTGRQDEAYKNVELEGGQEVEVSMILWDRPFRVVVEPFFAKNQRPLMAPLRVAEQVVEGKPKSYVRVVLEEERQINEIVVDNDDEGFSMPVRRTQRYLRPGLKGDNWQLREWPMAFGRYETNYRWKQGADGAQPAVWTARIPQVGEYDVAYYFITPRFAARLGLAASFSMTVVRAEQADTLQFERDQLEGGWNLLGRFRFAADEEVRVELSDRAGGRLYADAVRWRYVDPENPEEVYEEEISNWQSRGGRGRRGGGRGQDGASIGRIINDLLR